MTDLDVEDTLTNLNTQLNKSMVLMDATIENEVYQPKSNKSIKINTKIQPINSPKASSMSRKSILKKTERKDNVKAEQNIENNGDIINHNKTPTNLTTASRPHNITDLIKEEDLVVESPDCTFTLDDMSDSDDIWIMDIPRTVDPNELKNQKIMFGEKTKFKIRQERYYAITNNFKPNTTCVFNTGKVKSQYKAVKIKPAGAITVRRKLSGISNIKPMQIEDCTVPFPKNLKTRHPFFGVNYEGN